MSEGSYTYPKSWSDAFGPVNHPAIHTLGYHAERGPDGTRNTDILKRTLLN